MYLGSYGNTALIYALRVWGRPLTFTTPEKGDLDRKLSELMHESRDRLAQRSTQRPLQHGRVVVEHFARADEVQKEAMGRAKLLVARLHSAHGPLSIRGGGLDTPAPRKPK
jgi:hypothetical protein